MGQIMHPEKNPNVPFECGVCEDDISFDYYYHCDCSGTQRNYCYHHTEPVRMSASDAWKNLFDGCAKNERGDIIQSMHAIAKQIKKQNKHRVVVMDSIPLQQQPLINLDALNKVNMDFMRPQKKKTNLFESNGGFVVNVDPLSVAYSIDAVLNKQKNLNNIPMNFNNQFPYFHSVGNWTTHSIPSTTANNIPSNVYNIGNICNGNAKSTMNESKPLSLSQILGNAKNTPPAPSPFVSSPTPSSNTTNNHIAFSTLQSLINGHSNSNNASNLSLNHNHNLLNPLNLISPATNICNAIPSIIPMNDNQNETVTDSSTSTTNMTQNTNNNKETELQSIWGNAAFCSSSSASNSNSNTPQKTQPNDLYGIIPPSYQNINPNGVLCSA